MHSGPPGHDTVDEFRAIAEPLYRRDPIANTIELTVLQAANYQTIRCC